MLKTTKVVARSVSGFSFDTPVSLISAPKNVGFTFTAVIADIADIAAVITAFIAAALIAAAVITAVVAAVVVITAVITAVFAAAVIAAVIQFSAKHLLSVF